MRQEIKLLPMTTIAYYKTLAWGIYGEQDTIRGTATAIEKVSALVDLGMGFTKDMTLRPAEIDYCDDLSQRLLRIGAYEGEFI